MESSTTFTAESDMNDHDLLIELNTKLDVILKELDKYVTKQEFAPVKAIVYGGTGLILTSLIIAIFHMVVK